MLVIKRYPQSGRQHETIVLTIGDVRAVISVQDVRGDKVAIGIVAPPEVRVNRGEIQADIDAGIPAPSKTPKPPIMPVVRIGDRLPGATIYDPTIGEDYA